MDFGGMMEPKKQRHGLTQDDGERASGLRHDGGQDTQQSTATASVVLRVDNDYLGANPGGNLGTAQANPCCWLTPIGS